MLFMLVYSPRRLVVARVGRRQGQMGIRDRCCHHHETRWLGSRHGKDDHTAGDDVRRRKERSQHGPHHLLAGSLIDDIRSLGRRDTSLQHDRDVGFHTPTWRDDQCIAGPLRDRTPASSGRRTVCDEYGGLHLAAPSCLQHPATALVHPPFNRSAFSCRRTHISEGTQRNIATSLQRPLRQARPRLYIAQAADSQPRGPAHPNHAPPAPHTPTAPNPTCCGRAVTARRRHQHETPSHTAEPDIRKPVKY